MKKSLSLQQARRLSQGLFLVLFLFLFIQTESKGNDELGYPVRLFLDFDPLILVTTLLSAHAAAVAFYLSLIVIALTALLGRVFCGWVCPLGTLNTMAGALRKRNVGTMKPSWYRFKYFVLIFLVASSLFGMQLVGVMDPLSLLIRSFSVSIYPLFNYATRSFFDAMYGSAPGGLVSVSETVYGVLKKSVLSFQQPFYLQSTFIGFLFLTVIGLNLLEKRFWCKFLCPLGALLGLLSRYSVLKRSVSEDCTACGACATVCQGNAAPDEREGWKGTECVMCWNCDDICPHNAVRFGFGRGSGRAAMDLGRRRVITSFLTGAFAVPLIRTTPLTMPAYSDARLIRPPGSLDERDFLKRCVKCGECMKVCTTNGLQPTLLEAGLEGVWSPVLIPRIGYCEYRCTLCGQVCPTGAIRQLPPDEKVKVKIGLAMIDKGRCLPHAHGIPCIVCEEVCPTPKKAIWFDEVRVKDREGREVALQQPRVDLELCIGCGICETKCPVLGQPAIYVTNLGESRSRENQLLIS